MGWIEFVVWVSYGFSIGSAILCLGVISSTLVAPPSKGAPPIEEAKTFALRVPFFVLVVFGLVLQRPLRQHFDQHEVLGALVAFGALVFTLHTGLKILLPCFLTIKTTMDD